jgi:excisionase family DNA binding protein
MALDFNRLYTTKEVAEIFKVKDATVRDWIKQGDLPAFKVKSYYRITEPDLNEFANEQFKNLK